MQSHFQPLYPESITSQSIFPSAQGELRHGECSSPFGTERTTAKAETRTHHECVHTPYRWGIDRIVPSSTLHSLSDTHNNSFSRPVGSTLPKQPSLSSTASVLPDTTYRPPSATHIFSLATCQSIPATLRSFPRIDNFYDGDAARSQSLERQMLRQRDARLRNPLANQRQLKLYLMLIIGRQRRDIMHNIGTYLLGAS